MKLELSLESNSEINQLYHPTSKLKNDFYKVVYIKNNLNKTKFMPILLKEWFYLVKKNGQLIIDYQPNKTCDKEKLEQLMNWLWRDSYEIISHTNIDSDYLRFICRKKINTKIKGNTINKWTFGIITNGKRADWVRLIIDSIMEQKIPEYEIIICGTFEDRTEKDIKYISFNQRDDRGWITKKKNLIVKNAKYENICMLHDRMVLNKDWYKGMKRWGNCFESIGCRQLFEGKRVHDWLVSHYFVVNKDNKKFAFESYVDYRDWYKDIWFMGQLNIFKKSIIVKNNLWWDEKLYVGDREDYEFSKALTDAGFIHRFNDLASVETLINKYIDPTEVKYNPFSLTPQMKINSLNAFLKLSSYLFLRVLNFFGLQFSFRTLENTRGKIYTLIRAKN